MTPTLRCSELDRVLSCNGSMMLVPMVAPRSGDEGLEGTWLHHTAHSRMMDELKAVGEIGPTPPVPTTINFCQWIADYYYNTVKEIAPPDWSLECEVELVSDFPSFTLSGHIDCLAMKPDGTEAIGFDLKTGYDPVDEADCNEQIFGYMVLLLLAYPQLQRVTFYIIQPRNDEDEGYQRVSKVELTSTNVAVAAFEKRIERAIANRLEVSTSMKACKWCPAAMQCPAQTLLRQQMKAALTPEFLETIKKEPDDDALVQLVMDARSLNRPFEDATELLKERIRANGSAAGATIKKEGGAYSFPDPVAFYTASRRVFPDDAVYAGTVKPSVTKMKEAIAKTRNIPKSSKRGESAESVFETELRPLCEQGVREKIVFAP